MEIETFDQKNLRLLRTEIDNALKSIADKYNIQIKAGNASYSSSGETATFKLELATKKNGNIANKKDEIQRKTFEVYAEMIGLNKEDLDKSFSNEGKVYKIIGMNARSQKSPIIIERSDKKLYSMSTEAVIKLLKNSPVI